MASYGVQTANLFELLGDDVGDDEAPQEVATPVKPKPVVKLPKQAEKPAAKVVTTPPERQPLAGATANGRGTPGPRGRNGGSRGGGGGGRGRGFPDRDAPPPRRDAPPTDGENFGGEARRGPRGEGRGRGRGRGGFRADGGDRHSRNGFADGGGLKRDGQGKGNWGSDKDAIKAAGEGEEPKADEPIEEEPAPGTPPNGQITPTKEDAKDKEMTLDEYEKLMEEKRATLNKALKTPTYKVDTAKEFQGMKVVEKRDIEEDSPFELTNKKQIGARKAGLVEKERKEKAVIEANFRFNDDNRGRGRGRGGRGPGRGRFDGEDRPRPRDRDTNFRQGPRTNLHDENAFPSLAPPPVTLAN